MLFPTPEFVFVFLPVALIGFQWFGRFGRDAALAWLAFMSVVFYGAWRLDFVPLLLASIAFNYLAAVLIVRTRRRGRVPQAILASAIVVDLSALVFYKYLFPLLSFLNSAGIVKHHWDNVLLPLGISFFTFTQIGYLIDLSQDQGEMPHLIRYSVFVTFFPHLIAGPILYHQEVMPQLSEERRYRLRKEDVNVGLSWFLLGLAKKLLIADSIAPVANRAFAQAPGLTFVSAWVGVLAYAMQLYFDFSGYSDMAVGLARMFSIEFPLNFNSPYKARNIVDFWQRWHMTLTRYITMYVYNPITAWVMRRRLAAGQKISRKALITPGGFSSMLAMPMLVTMTLAGIWHGAGLQYIVFGFLHGLYLTINHLWRALRPKTAETVAPWFRHLSSAGATLLTFACVLVAQVFFRADSVSQAGTVLRAMAGWNGFGVPGFHSLMTAGVQGGAANVGNTLFAIWPASSSVLSPLLVLSALFLMVWTAPNTQELIKKWNGRPIPFELRIAAYSIAFYLVLFRSAKPQTFIYFQF